MHRGAMLFDINIRNLSSRSFFFSKAIISGLTSFVNGLMSSKKADGARYTFNDT